MLPYNFIVYCNKYDYDKYYLKINMILNSRRAFQVNIFFILRYIKTKNSIIYFFLLNIDLK